MKSLRFFEMQTRYLALLYGVIWALSLGSCHDDVIKNPCDGTTPFTANFEMYLGTGAPRLIVSPRGTVDTFYSGVSGNNGIGNLFFASVGTYDSVKWTVGFDNRVFTSKLFYLRFPSGSEKVDVRMIGYGKANKTCFPNDDGIDTAYSGFYQKIGDWPAVGNFQGALKSNPSDTFTVYMTAFSGNQYGDPGYFLYNFPKGNRGLQPGATESLTGQGNEIGSIGKFFQFRTAYGVSGRDGYDIDTRQTFGAVSNDTMRIYLVFSTTLDTFVAVRRR